MCVATVGIWFFTKSLVTNLPLLVTLPFFHFLSPWSGSGLGISWHLALLSPWCWRAASPKMKFGNKRRSVDRKCAERRTSATHVTWRLLACWTPVSGHLVVGMTHYQTASREEGTSRCAGVSGWVPTYQNQGAVLPMQLKIILILHGSVRTWDITMSWIGGGNGMMRTVPVKFVTTLFLKGVVFSRIQAMHKQLG